MAKRSDKTRERIQTVLFMFAVTFVCISVVAGAHLATRDTVARNESLYLKRAVAEAAGVELGRDAVLEWFEACVRPVTGQDGAVRDYRIVANGGSDETGLVCVRDGAGLWGRITAVVGLDREHVSLTGVTFVEQNETPGLGARIEEAWFKNQFKGKTGPFRIVPEKTGSPLPTDMDAITGATITTTAVRDILNRLIAASRQSNSNGREK